MKKPVLVIMAAGMGSRYGGMKQIDPVDEYGHIIVDFSIYDAYLAGFEEVIFVIKRENAEDFHNVIGNRIEKIMKVRYAFQELENLPEGFEVPAGRVKPWGTAHAILSCKDMIDGPFAVINADDYYGREAFKQIYDYLSVHEDNEKYQYAMVGYQLKNTLTENGSVARGVCDIDGDGKLVSVTEHTTIVKRGENAAYTEDDGKSYTDLAGDTIVSMNLWGFSKGFLSEIAYGFRDFLQEGLQHNPLKCEYYLPSVVSRLLDSNKAGVKVLLTTEKWYGVTYREEIVDCFQDLLRSGKISFRVTHNDTKINNVLMDKDTKKGICVIDLDTVMPGAAMNDFGDAVRIGASTALEDEQNLDKVWCDLELFEACAKGFIEGCGGKLSQEEIKLLPMGARLMTYECGMRFLMDYIQGDIYFKIHRPGQNLDRARTQFKLVSDMEHKWKVMENIVKKYM